MTDTLTHDERLYEPHQGQHQECAPCFQIKLGSIQFQGIGAGDRRQSEKSRTLDMEEYQKARRAGLQPKHVFGTHEVMAQAGSTFEIENSVIMSKEVRKEMNARLADFPAPPPPVIPKGGV